MKRISPPVVTTAAGHEPNQGMQAASASRDLYPFSRDPWWSRLLVLTIVFVPLLAIGYAAVRFWGRGVSGTELWLLFGLWTFTGLGVTVGFHRMLTHRAFTAKPVTKFLLLVAGTMAVEGPPAVWAATHMRHHAKADRDGDPHSPVEGFWHAHAAWMVRDRFVLKGLAYEKLMDDPIVRFVSRTWGIWAGISILLPFAIGFAVHATWLGALDAFAWGGLIRIFLLHHTTWSVNSIGHMFGSRPFKTTDRGANNALVALFGWGEGWHNNHHAFPRAAYIGMRWWQIDLGAWLIVALKWTGQVTNVWQPSADEKKARLVETRAVGP